MKRFLIQCCLFLIILIVVLSAGEIAIRRLPNLYRQKTDYMDLHPERISTLVLGHSQMFYGVDPGILGDSAYNLANVSQTLSIDRELLEYYAPRLTNLRNVIIPLTYTSLYDLPMEESSEWWRIIKYNLYTHVRHHSFFSRYGAEIFNPPGYAGQIGVLIGRRKPQLISDSLGHGIGYEVRRKDPEWQGSAVTTARYHTEWLHPEMKLSNINQIVMMDSICRQYGARLIIVTPPVWDGYLQNIDNSYLKEMTATADSLSRTRGISYYDFSAHPDFSDKDFYDSDHLSSDVGAARFSKILQGIIKK